MVFRCFSKRCHVNMCNLNVIVVLEFISRDLYLLFAILFSSKFQNLFFYQHMRPKSGLKSPWPFCCYLKKKKKKKKNLLKHNTKINPDTTSVEGNSKQCIQIPQSTSVAVTQNISVQCEGRTNDIRVISTTL